MPRRHSGKVQHTHTAGVANGLIVRPSTSPETGLLAMRHPPPTGTSSLQPCQDTHMTDISQEIGSEPALLRALRRAPSKRSTPSVVTTTQRPSTSGQILPVGTMFKTASIRGRSADGPGAMVVEGTQTGEERIIETTPPREAASRQPASFAVLRQTDPYVKKLEVEVRRLTDVVKSQSKECQALRSEIEHAKQAHQREGEASESKLSQLRMKVKELEEQQGWHHSRHARDVEDLERQLREERSRMSNLRNATEDRESEARIKAREMEDTIHSLQQERTDLLAKVGSLRDEIERLHETSKRKSEEADQTYREYSKLKGQQGSRDQMICQLKAALAEDAATLERTRDELRENRGQLVQKEAELIEYTRKCNQLQEYVMKICQPHFAVVKDESLTPVNISGFQVTEGHVLVPLILLLEGYALLPPQMKSVVDIKSSRLAKGIDYSQQATALEAGYSTTTRMALSEGPPSARRRSSYDFSESRIERRLSSAGGESTSRGIHGGKDSRRPPSSSM